MKTNENIERGNYMPLLKVIAHDAGQIVQLAEICVQLENQGNKSGARMEVSAVLARTLELRDLMSAIRDNFGNLPPKLYELITYGSVLEEISQED